MSNVSRRQALGQLAALPVVAAACTRTTCAKEPAMKTSQSATSLAPPATIDPVLAVAPLTTPWQTFDPFLFCMHHNDLYPAGQSDLGPARERLSGRAVGQDFSGKDGWSMYHGQVVPGFPQHPHRGFETVTITRKGLVDHADSLGAAARYGEGDVQWLTAGEGIQHAEMFPLLHQDQPNHGELFQVWLNLPARRKMVAPYFTMFWADQIPQQTFADAAGHETHVRVIAGSLEHLHALAPPPDSWASQPGNDVAIWTITLQPGATWTVPPAQIGSNRTLYLFEGKDLRIGPRTIAERQAVRIQADQPAVLQAGPAGAELVLLQGRPIGEPVVQHGPFVMNSRQEIVQAIRDYQRTQFGSWPWPRNDPVHGNELKHFAKRPDGVIERPA